MEVDQKAQTNFRFHIQNTENNAKNLVYYYQKKGVRL